LACFTAEFFDACICVSTSRAPQNPMRLVGVAKLTDQGSAVNSRPRPPKFAMTSIVRLTFWRPHSMPVHTQAGIGGAFTA
jgi:hypothetical protein